MLAQLSCNHKVAVYLQATRTCNLAESNAFPSAYQDSRICQKILSGMMRDCAGPASPAEFTFQGMFDLVRPILLGIGSQGAREDLSLS